MEATEIVCSTCKRAGILEHGICQSCWLESWHTNIECHCGKFLSQHPCYEPHDFKPIVSFTDYKAFYGMTPKEIAAHRVR